MRTRQYVMRFPQLIDFLMSQLPVWKMPGCGGQGPLGLHGLTKQLPPLHNRVDPALAFTFDTANAVAFLHSQGTVIFSSTELTECSISAGDGSASCVVGVEATFTITLRDKSNQPVMDASVGTHLHVAWLDATGQVDFRNVTASRLAVAAVPGHPEHWRVSYCWPDDTPTGLRRLSVQLADQVLSVSPLNIHVEARGPVRRQASRSP
jgi:hypothetical protein